MKATISGYVYWFKFDFMDAPKYTFHNTATLANGSPEYALIGPHTIEVDIPDDFDPTPGRIATMKAEKQRILAEAHVKAENIEEQIQKLLCLEFKPEVAP